jgi:hypothetical protein
MDSLDSRMFAECDDGQLISTSVREKKWFKICKDGIDASDASILCKHESIMDSLETKMFVGCNNGRLRSISIQEKEWPHKYWIFIGMIEEIENGKHDFVLSEKYELFNSLRFEALTDGFVESKDVFYLATMFFQKGRTVFLNIHKPPRVPILQLNEETVTLNKNIKIARLQKADIFTSDSIKIPNIIISRGAGLHGIDTMKIKNFHSSLIDGEFIIQFDYINMRFLSNVDRSWRGRKERHQYRFRIPVSTENSIRK